ncbi:uncharacterized protein [Choristoneura fumiferana]|uniref:uncharacterized protein n=1 Tax=Choristoneura fumiferana TaxID=7141 RepID=UPI003D1536F3
MSDKKCCVPGCADNKGSHKTLHGFPNPVTDSERFRTWIYAVGGDILKLKNEYIYKYCCVCHAHFEERFCCRFNEISNIATPNSSHARLVGSKINVVRTKAFKTN